MKRPALRRAGPVLRRTAPAIWFALLAAAVTAPWWLRDGYVWLLDSVWGPHQPIYWSHPTANLAWQIYARILTAIIGAPAAEKFTLTAVLFAAGLGGHYLARRFLPRGWSLAAGTMYLLNPFVYDRLLAGQWVVLAGYALLPASLAVADSALESRGRRGAYRLAAIIGFFPLVSPHFAFINALLLLGLLAVHCLVHRPSWLLARRPAIWLGALLAGAAALNWFWLTSAAGRAYQAFGGLDFANFRTAADPVLGVWVNVLGLYGFWRGAAFIQPKFWLGPVWLLISAAILALTVAGAVRGWQRRRALLITLAAAVPVALVLSVGYASPFAKPVTDALIAGLPGFRGLRDSSKFIGVLALAYAMLAPYGAAWATTALELPRAASRLAPIGLIILAAVSVTGLIPGAAGQVTVANYPASWTTAAARLAKDPSAPVAVLPWHNYLHLNFAGDTYAAQPAPVLFSNPLLSSDETDSVLAARPDTPADRLMLAATSGRITAQQWAAGLRQLGARYVVLEKTDDWSSYKPLINAAGLQPIHGDPAIAVYRL